MSSCTLRRLLMAAALGVLTLPGPARADTDAFHRLKEHLDWGGFTEARALAPKVPWAVIIATRNRLIHAYFDIDRDIVSTAATRELPALLPTLLSLVPED